MVVVLARDLADGELGAAGAAALVPMAAIALARELHAPNLTVGGEMFFNPEPGRLYPSMLDDRALGRCEAAETFIELFGHSHHGLEFFFHSGLQHDAYGNINLHHVGGTLHAPKVRGPGAANLSYCHTSTRFYICPTLHTTRNFVEKVDFVTIPGHLSGPEAKRVSRPDQRRAAVRSDTPRGSGFRPGDAADATEICPRGPYGRRGSAPHGV